MLLTIGIGVFLWVKWSVSYSIIIQLCFLRNNDVKQGGMLSPLFISYCWFCGPVHEY